MATTAIEHRRAPAPRRGPDVVQEWQRTIKKWKNDHMDATNPFNWHGLWPRPLIYDCPPDAKNANNWNRCRYTDNDVYVFDPEIEHLPDFLKEDFDGKLKEIRRPLSKDWDIEMTEEVDYSLSNEAEKRDLTDTFDSKEGEHQLFTHGQYNDTARVLSISSAWRPHPIASDHDTLPLAPASREHRLVDNDRAKTLGLFLVLFCMLSFGGVRTLYKWRRDRHRREADVSTADRMSVLGAWNEELGLNRHDVDGNSVII
jgi:hypothetical protein